MRCSETSKLGRLSPVEPSSLGPAEDQEPRIPEEEPPGKCCNHGGMKLDGYSSREGAG